MHLKRLDGELIIGGDKDDWRPLIPQQLRHIKPIQHRHLNIEEQQIRLQFTRHPDHLLSVDCLTHHLHSIPELLKQQSHPVSCGLLIICHEDPQSGISLFHEPEFLKSLCCLQQTSWPLARDAAPSSPSHCAGPFRCAWHHQSHRVENRVHCRSLQLSAPHR